MLPQIRKDRGTDEVLPRLCVTVQARYREVARDYLTMHHFRLVGGSGVGEEANPFLPLWIQAHVGVVVILGFWDPEIIVERRRGDVDHHITYSDEIPLCDREISVELAHQLW